MERDHENDKKLLFLGWTVIHFWGEDITKRTDECVRVIEECILEQKLESMEDDWEKEASEEDDWEKDGYLE